MRASHRAALVAAIACVLPSRVAVGQQMPRWDLAIQLGAAPPSVADGWFGGQYAGARQSTLTLRAAHPLLALGRVSLRYEVQLDPVMHLSGVERYRVVEGTPRLVLVEPGGRATGAALVPLMLGVDARVIGRLSVRGASGVGVALLSERVPTAEGRHRNFIAQWEAGVTYRVTRRHLVEGGVRWRHLSNGYTGFENPGIDSRLAYVGVTFTTGTR